MYLLGRELITEPWDLPNPRLEWTTAVSPGVGGVCGAADPEERKNI